MTGRIHYCGVAGCLAAVLAGCDWMKNQPRYDPLEASTFFADGMSARPVVDGTVPHGEDRSNTAFYEGRVGGKYVTELPVRLTAELVHRGQERFNIYCSPCHGRTGAGDGMIVERGFTQPPSYHIQRLRDAPVGHFFDVITNGFGAMYSYAERVEPADRWAITAYIRALQLSQYASLDDVPAAERAGLQGGQQ